MKQPKEILCDATSITDEEVYSLKEQGYRVKFDFDSNVFHAIKR
jgi:hypothetical protein